MQIIWVQYDLREKKSFENKLISFFFSAQIRRKIAGHPTQKVKYPPDESDVGNHWIHHSQVRLSRSQFTTSVLKGTDWFKNEAVHVQHCGRFSALITEMPFSAECMIVKFNARESQSTSGENAEIAHAAKKFHSRFFFTFCPLAADWHVSDVYNAFYNPQG